MNLIKINLPYAKRHFQPEIKTRGGKFVSEDKTWTLPDTEDNRHFVALIEQPLAAPTYKERVQNVVMTCVELLNAVGKTKYKIVDVGERIVIEQATKE